jgi:hypothetical protein
LRQLSGDQRSAIVKHSTISVAYTCRSRSMPAKAE